MSIYGITESGLADQIESTVEEARELLNNFRQGLPGFLSWEKEVHSKIMSKGYSETVLGRKRRFIALINEAKNEHTYARTGTHWKIEKCKRQGANFCIQGSAADQTKSAMVRLFYPTRSDGSLCFDRREWVREGYRSILEENDIHIALQVHDELVFDAPAATPKSTYEKIGEIMANVIPNEEGIEFTTDVEVAPYWGGKFSQEQLQKMANGELNWVDIFQEEVVKKLNKFGIEYSLGDFIEDEEEED